MSTTNELPKTDLEAKLDELQGRVYHLCCEANRVANEASQIQLLIEQLKQLLPPF